MVSISIEKFIKSYLKNNKDVNTNEIKKALKGSVKDKENGTTCMKCGNPIWSIGKAIVGWNGCFTCITGETEHDDDYEINEVNF
ncbi:hypothetical protein ACFFIX_20265 [Metabacillus herbersteinensis]|uniref:Uncharacterized protein n=1 Tax=Metabacillus herbersteinensis TaxID=283816 RepID=A0ABV6GJ69_9BACI